MFGLYSPVTVCQNTVGITDLPREDHKGLNSPLNDTYSPISLLCIKLNKTCSKD